MRIRRGGGRRGWREREVRDRWRDWGKEVGGCVHEGEDMMERGVFMRERK